MARAPMRALIVDDEPHARRYLFELLDGESDVLVVGEASNGAEGIRQIKALSPDVVFLDIQMPDLDGLNLVGKIEFPKLPLFVFVTGYAEYAVQAFEIDAVDYLCKPFGKERLLTALDRANRRAKFKEVSIKEDQNLWLSRLPVRNEYGLIFLPVDHILWIEAANKYVVIHTTVGTHVVRQTIQSLQDKLDPRQFVRIHRSTVVRKSAVRGLHPLFHGDYIVRLTNGDEVTLSRSFRASFFRQMGA